MSKHLNRELEQLKKDILAFGARIENAIEKTIIALEQKRVDVAEEVIAEDHNLDKTEVEIEESCLKILALHQPVAEDLRFVAAVIRINNDLERVGDYAVTIAERALDLKGQTFTPPKDMRKLSQMARQMLHDSLDAFVKRDPQMARQICVQDDQVDTLHRQMILEIKKRMHESPENIEAGLDFFTAIRRLERIADMATNIAQDVVYMVEGEIIRHRAEEYPR